MNSVKMSPFVHNEKGFLSFQGYFITERLSNGNKKYFQTRNLVIGLKKQACY